MKHTKVSLAVMAVLLSACATTSPPVTDKATPVEVTKVPITAQPMSVTIMIPSWYMKQPESTVDAIYVAGSGLSRDLTMSEDKAQLDAESRLASKIAGEISTLTKDYKRDVGDEFVQSTEIVATKIANDVKVIGATVVDRLITPEGNGFRTYVLLKYPLGNSNTLLQHYVNKKSFKGSKDAAEQELAAKTAERRTREDAEYKTAPVIVTTPKVVPETNQTVTQPITPFVMQ